MCRSAIPRAGARWSSTLLKPKPCAVFLRYISNSAACARSSRGADQLGLSTKRSITADGCERGGKPLSRGHIYRLLSNPIYTGQIAHKGQLYPGQHPALIDAETWTTVQDQLAVKARRHRSKVDAAEPSLLTGC
jgi:hypothetical protein